MTFFNGHTIDSFLVVDANTNPPTMHCKCCDERYPLVQCKLITAQHMLDAFQNAHIEMGCTQEKYERQKLMEDI